MKQSLNMREANHYYKKCSSMFSWQVNPRQDPFHPYLLEKEPSYQPAFPPIHVRPHELTGTELLEALNTCFDRPSLFPDEYTYYLLDISHNKETTYNTIMYHLNEPPKKSIETTTVIMNRYFDSKYFSYSCMKKFAEPLGYSYVLPYILGETFFVPERGASKQTTSWYALHHAIHHNFDPIEKKLILFSDQHPLLSLDLSLSAFEKQLNIAAHLYFVQKKLIDEIVSHIGFIRMVNRPVNSVHKWLERKAYQLPEFTAIDYLEFITYFKSQQCIFSLYGEDNPYLEDIRAFFQLPEINS